MLQASPLIDSPAGVLTVLTGIAALFFLLEARLKWKLFSYFPPLLFIYAIPVILSNTGVIPADSPVYGGLRRYGLPFFLTILLLDVDVGAALRVMGRGLGVMLFGTAGVMVGAPVAYAVVHRFLDPEAWRGYGALAGSWIGGTGNMAAVSEALSAPREMFGLAALADNVVYLVWLPIMLASRNWAARFARFTGVAHEERLAAMEAAVAELQAKSNEVGIRHVLYLGFIGMAVTWVSIVAGEALAARVDAALTPEMRRVIPALGASTFIVLVVTTLGIALSFTPAKRIPGSHNLAMGVVYLFVAVMGAGASVSAFGQAVPFVAGAFLWIFIHGAFCLLGARVFRVDVHTAAIASAANIGGAASAPVVASYHNEKLVPVSILMALIGYAIGNYAAIVTGWLCYWAARVT